MNPSDNSLDPFFHDCVQRGEPFVLATIVRTIGSTYRKPGAHMLLRADGASAGLLSGGCVESDLTERAREVLRTGRPALVDYDARSSDDVIWGLGLGCEGAMRILLMRLDASSGYEPYAFQSECRKAHTPGRVAFVIESERSDLPVGTYFLSSGQERPIPSPVRSALSNLSPLAAQEINTEGVTILVCEIPLRPRLLLLGAGPDAMPLVEFAGLLDWHVSVFDHRPSYAAAQRFPRASRVVSQPAARLREELKTSRYDAAIVMSHHLPSDETYLAALAESDIQYIGLLGPAPRRMRLMHALGDCAQRLHGRLYGPIGLDIGASTPEGIALAIVAEIQAVRAGRSGVSFSKTAP
jgi:xanthine/CO dehydrogenase XdhC/CoxF family maturation factor